MRGFSSILKDLNKEQIKELLPSILVQYEGIEKSVFEIKDILKPFLDEKQDIDMSIHGNRALEPLYGTKLSKKERKLEETKLNYCVKILDIEAKYESMEKIKNDADNIIQSAVNEVSELNAKISEQV